jgi:Predicted membrane protein involved in D-alanine export
MDLNSITFIIFLTVTTGIYYLLPHRCQNPFLLLASYVFYIWAAPLYSLLLLFSTTLSYFAARAISLGKTQKLRRAFMISGIVFHLLVLCLFKYYSFFTETPAVALSILPKADDAFSLILPIGISFYTFQIVGYLIDVYNKKTEHEANFLTYALFISFFPQILAGPIARAGEMLPQYREKHTFDYGTVVEGMQRFLTGAFKKVVVADGLAIFTNGIYNNITEYKGPMLVFAAVLYAVQIYCDFSGYTDMAVGAAGILGFKLRENFNAPYMATNLSGFWQRWHMSLTSWLNDYVFIPLVWSRWYNKLFFGKKHEDHKPHIITNLMIVFLISGLWHGSTINFFIWGALHGIFRALEELLNRAKKKKKKSGGFLVRNLKRLGVFGISVLTHIFFRARTLADIGYFFSNLFVSETWKYMRDQLFSLGLNGMKSTNLYFLMLFGTLFVGLVVTVCLDVSIDRSLKNRALCLNPLQKLGPKKRWAAYWLMALLTVMYYLISITGTSGAGQFIYAGY